MKTRAKRFLFGGLVAMAYLYCFPYFPGMHSANELPRIYLTMAMVDEGSFAIDTGAERWGKTVDMSPSKGHLYSNKAPGSSMLAVPAYAVLKSAKDLTGAEPSLAELTWAFRFATGIVPTLLFLSLMWKFLRGFAPSPQSRRLILLAYGIGSMAMTYSTLFIAHQLAAVCIMSAYVVGTWVVEERLHRRWLWAAGFLAGSAPLVDYQAAFAGVPIGIYLVYQLGLRRRENRIGILYAIGGAIPPIVLLLYYHAAAFGGPFRTGYEASESFAHFHQQGFLGMDQLRLEAFTGSTIASDNGLLVFCPMLLLALPGWYLMARRGRWWHLGVTLSVAVIYLLFVSSINFWRGGWQVGPRYITAMLPFLLVPIAVAVTWAERRWAARAFVIGLIGVGVVVYGLSNALFPHFPEKFSNPLYGLVFRLLGDGEAPYNAGWLLGLKGFASLVPYLILVCGLSVWCACPSREERRSALVGLGITVAIVASYSFFPGGGATADGAYQWVVSVMP
ncbi:MAG: hypothetical protein GY811_12960 [Myxococcales bacterium]|nr:hypothetical protein [Myxococcales bacterium]